jgi:hypothetical protein
MITTTTFLMAAPCVTGVGVGEGVGVTDEFFTPPHPIVRARTRGLKKNKIARLKGTAPLRGFESALPSLVGSEVTVF